MPCSPKERQRLKEKGEGQEPPFCRVPNRERLKEKILKERG